MLTTRKREIVANLRIS